MLVCEHLVHCDGAVLKGDEAVAVLCGVLLEGVAVYLCKDGNVAGKDLLIGDAYVTHSGAAGIYAQVQLIAVGMHEALGVGHVVYPVELGLVVLDNLGLELELESLGVVHLVDEVLGEGVCAKGHVLCLPGLVLNVHKDAVVYSAVIGILEVGGIHRAHDPLLGISVGGYGLLAAAHLILGL